MKEYQWRVVDEKAELDKKLANLSSFISSDKFKKLFEDEQSRLLIQQHIMCGYSAILGSRIAAFKLME